VVAKSSTEAEYRSMALVVIEMYWLHMLFKELTIPLVNQPCLWVDNLGAFSLSSNPMFHARMKHIEVDYHFIREKIFIKDIIARHISTHDQPSDIFTEGMSKDRFILLRDKLKGDVNIIDSMISTVETNIQKCHTIVQTHKDKVVTEDESS
jgi:GrpB-like predicted nucleotidyltransferase (UPF0157 family)